MHSEVYTKAANEMLTASGIPAALSADHQARLTEVEALYKTADATPLGGGPQALPLIVVSHTGDDRRGEPGRRDLPWPSTDPRRRDEGASVTVARSGTCRVNPCTAGERRRVGCVAPRES